MILCVCSCLQCGQCAEIHRGGHQEEVTGLNLLWEVLVWVIACAMYKEQVIEQGGFGVAVRNKHC